MTRRLHGRTPSRVAGRVVAALVAALLLLASGVSAQVPAVIIGGYVARHGLGVELTWLLHERAGLQARLETSTVERAAWFGGRLDVISSDDGRVYVAPLVGRHYCFPNNLSGTGSGCPSDADWKTAATLLGGVDLPLGAGHPWSLGVESGYRFVDAGTRSRWAFAATVRYRFGGRN